jgi:hypothetical protein
MPIAAILAIMNAVRNVFRSWRFDSLAVLSASSASRSPTVQCSVQRARSDGGSFLTRASEIRQPTYVMRMVHTL